MLADDYYTCLTWYFLELDKRIRDIICFGFVKKYKYISDKNICNKSETISMQNIGSEKSI